MMQDVENLPELAARHIILGRYNGKKTKPLNDSGVTKAYRNFRKTIHRKRTYDDQAAENLRGEITQHIRDKLNLPNLDLIQFVVDIHRVQALSDRQQHIIWNAQPQMFYNRSEGIVFVEDKTHYFFKQELKEKRHQAKDAKDGSTPTTNAVASPSPTTIPPSPGPDYYPAEESLPPIASAISPSPTHDEMNLSDDEDETGIDEDEYKRMMTEDIAEMSDPTEGMSSDLDMDLSFSPGNVVKFEFAEGDGTLDEQIQSFCAHFCKNSGDDMDEIMRKSKMVESFRSHFQTFKKLLSVNPFESSPLPVLRGLPQMLLIECATVMLNGMTEVYQRCPLSCLEGEADAWTGNAYASGGLGQNCGMLSANSSVQMHSIAFSLPPPNALPMPALDEEQNVGSMRQRPDPPIDLHQAYHGPHNGFQNPSTQIQSWFQDFQEDSELEFVNPTHRYNSEWRSLGGLIRDDSADGEGSLVFLQYAAKYNNKKGKKEKGTEPLVIKSNGPAKEDGQKKEPEEDIQAHVITSSSGRPVLRSQEEVYQWFAPRLRRAKIYTKKVTSFIRKANKGERVVTVIDGKQETKYQVKDDDSWLVCGKAAGEYYSLTDQQFKANYDTESAKDIAIDDPHPLAKRLRKQGFMEYRSSRKVRARQVTENDMKFFRRGIEDEANPGAYFIAPWGESMLVEEGDYIVMQHPEKNREIYRIAHRVFHDSYYDGEELEKKEEKKQQPLVLGSSTLVVGAAVLVAALVLPKLMFSSRKTV